MQNMPIGIFRGDDTDAFSYQTIVGTINTDLDLTGCKAVFRYLGFSMEFDPIPEDRKLTIVIPADETKKFPPGLGYASLRVYDSDGRLKTFSNRIMVFVATKTPMFGSDEFEVDFNVRASLEPLKFFVGPNPDDFDEYRGYLEKVIDRASAAKYGLAILLDAIDSDLGANDGVAATPVAVKAAYAAIIGKLTNDYYTAEQTDEAIDRVAAYYITYDAAGNPFPTYAALANAQTVYSGGHVRTPTRNDYCVVLADETHDNAEYRYIYAVADGETTGSWQPQFPVEGVMTVDQTVTKNSHNPVSGGGVWSAIWGALSALPTGFSSLYDWCVAQLGYKRDLTDMSCTADIAGIPQIGSGKFVVSSPSGTSTTLTPFDSSGVIGWGWYMTYPYIYARASNSYDIIFGTGISDMIPLDMTAKTQTVTYNGETWTVDAFTGATVNTRLANMTDIPAPSTAIPAMDSGAGSAGTSEEYARGDHVHPSDTSKQNALSTQQLANIAAVPDKLDKSGGTMTGNLTVYNEDGPYAEIKAETAENSIAIRQRGNVSTLETDDYTYVMPPRSGTLALAAPDPTAGNLAALDANGNPTDAGWTAGDIARYALTTKTINNGAVSLDDRAINAVAVSSPLASLTVNFPTATSGKARDFGLRLTVASGITTAPELALPQGVTCENADGEAPEIGADGAATILYFTETASGVFLVKGEVLQTITAIS